MVLYKMDHTTNILHAYIMRDSKLYPLYNCLPLCVGGCILDVWTCWLQTLYHASFGNFSGAEYK